MMMMMMTTQVCGYVLNVKLLVLAKSPVYIVRISIKPKKLSSFFLPILFHFLIWLKVMLQFKEEGDEVMNTNIYII